MPLLLCCSQASELPGSSQRSNSNAIIMDPLLRIIDMALSNYYEAVRWHYFTTNKARAGMLLQSILIPGVRTNTLLITTHRRCASATGVLFPLCTVKIHIVEYHPSNRNCTSCLLLIVDSSKFFKVSHTMRACRD
jgi:hypothetical protein